MGTRRRPPKTAGDAVIAKLEVPAKASLRKALELRRPTREEAEQVMRRQLLVSNRLLDIEFSV